MFAQEDSATFSLESYYRGNSKAALADWTLLVLLFFLIIAAPLPFGSVLYTPVATIELISVLCFLVWIFKLCFFGCRQALDAFADFHTVEKESLQRAPFFHHHRFLAHFFRLITLGRWPLKNIAFNLTQNRSITTTRYTYFSIFAYPIRNTGIELPVLAFLLIGCLQLLFLPSYLLSFLSPSTYSIFKNAITVTGMTADWHSLSLDRFATASEIVKYSSFFLIYVVVVNSAFRSRHFYTLAIAFILSGLFQSGYGLYQYLRNDYHIFSYLNIYNMGTATGTFINHSHYAAYLGMCFPLPFAIASGLTVLRRSSTERIGVRIARTFETKGSQAVVLFTVCMILFLGLLFSLSRGGILSAIGSLIVFFLLVFGMYPKLSRKVYFVLILIGFVCIALWIGPIPLIKRFSSLSQRFGQQERWGIWEGAVQICRAFPLTGTGLGTFYQVFPAFRTVPRFNQFFVRHAHNEYLEFISEIGIAAVFVIAALIYAFLRRLREIQVEPSRRIKFWEIGLFCSLLCIAIHSFMDFSLRIPANALSAAILSGLYFATTNAE
jgi:O-antigen ligase